MKFSPFFSGWNFFLHVNHKLSQVWGSIFKTRVTHFIFCLFKSISLYHSSSVHFSLFLIFSFLTLYSLSQQLLIQLQTLLKSCKQQRQWLIKVERVQKKIMLFGKFIWAFARTGIKNIYEEICKTYRYQLLIWRGRRKLVVIFFLFGSVELADFWWSLVYSHCIFKEAEFLKEKKMIYPTPQSFNDSNPNSTKLAVTFAFFALLVTPLQVPKVE